MQRRPLIGSLRAIGVSRAEIFALVMGEALLIGAVGTAAGLLLGLGMARGLLGLVTRTINDLYFVLSVRDVALDPLTLGKGVLLGMGATALAALGPALEATGAPPRVVMSRAALETSARCPLHDDADVAFYDQESVTAALAVRLLTLPRTLPITLARDRATREGGHEPMPVQLLEPRGKGAHTRSR